MIDAILLAALGAVFAGGFWCGSKYGSGKNMLTAAKTAVSGWLK